MSYARKAEPTGMPFEVWMRVGPGNHGPRSPEGAISGASPSQLIGNCEGCPSYLLGGRAKQPFAISTAVNCDYY